ncbi:MAG: ribbon-helix-helix domain-containing protein [Anaerolineae bacterium]|nr:ribbon-helix-helix domain-containing protein [Anaerolineae bacterium]
MSSLANKPLQIYLRDEQMAMLRALARRRGVSLAELIRQGVDRLLAEVPAAEDPLSDIVGFFDSGQGDLAERHDAYLVRVGQEEKRTWSAKSS